jgi:hypothetical protein
VMLLEVGVERFEVIDGHAVILWFPLERYLFYEHQNQPMVSSLNQYIPYIYIYIYRFKGQKDKKCIQRSLYTLYTHGRTLASESGWNDIVLIVRRGTNIHFNTPFQLTKQLFWFLRWNEMSVRDSNVHFMRCTF